jgi:hypothetical protein
MSDSSDSNENQKSSIVESTPESSEKSVMMETKGHDDKDHEGGIKEDFGEKNFNHKYYQGQANAKYLCPCQLCKMIRQSKIDYLSNPEDMSFADLQNRNSMLKKNLVTEYDNDYPFILRRLYNNVNSNGQLRIPIPDSILFEDGEIRYTVTSKDGILNKITKHRESLHPNDMRKMFMEIFKNKQAKDKEYRAFSQLGATHFSDNTKDGSLPMGG